MREITCDGCGTKDKSAKIAQYGFALFDVAEGNHLVGEDRDYCGKCFQAAIEDFRAYVRGLKIAAQ